MKAKLLFAFCLGAGTTSDAFSRSPWLKGLRDTPRLRSLSPDPAREKMLCASEGGMQAESEAGDEAPVHDEVSGVPAECVLGAIDGAQHHCGRVAAKRQEHRREHHSARKRHRGGENPLVSGPALPFQQGRDAIDGVRARLAIVTNVVKYNREAFARLHLLPIQGVRNVRAEGGGGHASGVTSARARAP